MIYSKFTNYRPISFIDHPHGPIPLTRKTQRMEVRGQRALMGQQNFNMRPLFVSNLKQSVHVVVVTNVPLH